MVVMLYKNYIIKVILFTFLSIAVSACVPELTYLPIPPTPTIMSISDASALPPTSTETANSQSDYYQPEDLPVTPTPTPVIHTVQSGETLSSIAIQYETTIDDILSANPGIDPNLLPLGITLTIPYSNTNQSFIPLPTPVELETGKPVCFYSADMSLTCFIYISNNSDKTIENVSILVTLYDKQKDNYHQKRALLPQNTLPPQSSIPAVVRFYNISEDSYITSYHVETAIVATDTQARYADIENDVILNQISPTQLSAKIEGNIVIKDNPEEQTRVTITAIAKDKDNNPIGFRKITIPPNDSQPVFYSFYVYTLGPPIFSVDVYAEALILKEN